MEFQSSAVKEYVTNMDIVLYGNPVLRQVATPVATIDEHIKKLADAMVRALTLKKGYGLAAPQVGVSKRLIVLDVEQFFEIVVNPEIVEMRGNIALGREGCLSIPGAEAQVPRHQCVVFRGTRLDGTPFELEACDLLARVIQHEVDHLNGVLFIDHIGEAKRLQVLKDFERHLKEAKAKA